MLETIRRFPIVNGGALVKRVIGNFWRCRGYLAAVGKQMMTPLTAFRTQQGWIPFQFLEIDHFGPLLVGHSWKTNGCLLTCFQIFAVHLEVSHSLMTDSFIVSPLRFMSRRATPSKIVGDKGMKFVGAQSRLKSLVKIWSTGRIFHRLRQKGM